MLSRNSAFYYLVANISLALVPFILMPILTRELGVEGYGEVAIFLIVTSISGSLIGLSANSSISAKWYKFKAKELNEYIASCVYVNVLLMMAFLVVANLVSTFFSEILSLSRFWLNVAVLIGYLNSLIMIRLTIWQLTGAPFKYALIQVTNALIIGTVSYALVVFFSGGVDGRLYGHFFGFLVTYVFVFYSLFKDGYLTSKIRLNYVSGVFDFGLPLVPHTLGAFILNSVDRIILNNSLGVEFVGIYMVAVQLSLVLNIIGDSINKATLPRLYKVLKSNVFSEKIKIVQKVYAISFFYVLCALFSYFLGPWIVCIIAGKEFSESAKVLPMLVLAQAFHGMYLLVTNYIFYEEKTHFTAIATITSASIGLIVMFLSIEKFGMYGAASGQIVGMLSLWLLTWFFANRVHPMPWFSLSLFKLKISDSGHK